MHAASLGWNDEGYDVLTTLEADTVARGCMLARKRSDTYAVPCATIRDVRLDDIRLVATRAKLKGKLIRFGLCPEGADLELVTTLFARSCRRLSCRSNLSRVVGRSRQRIAWTRHDR